MNSVITLGAKLISFIMHPLFMMSYVLLILLKYNPYLFGMPKSGLDLLLISVVMLSVFFPLVAIAMMKQLDMIDSFQMETRKERIGPLIATGIFYLWLYLNIKDNTGVSEAFSFFVLGTVIALFTAFFINNFSKISLHAVGMGGLVTGIFLIRQYFTYDAANFSLGSLGVFSVHINVILLAVILLCGLVASSRLLLKAHKSQDITGGLIVGVIAQLIAFAIFF